MTGANFIPFARRTFSMSTNVSYKILSYSYDLSPYKVLLTRLQWFIVITIKLKVTCRFLVIPVSLF